MVMKKLYAAAISTLVLLASVFCIPVHAEDNMYKAQLYGEVTDAGEVVNKMVIDFGNNIRISGLEKDTFTVHAQAFIQAGAKKGQSYYDLDRTIVKIETKGSQAIIYFDETEGSTLTWLDEGRNYPAKLNYTITQNKPIKATAIDGRELPDITGLYTCDNTVINSETAKFESVIVENGINYQFYNAENSDKLVVWFHGNGEGDFNNSDNNVAQMLGNRGTVAWATDEIQEIFGGAHVMALQAPDTWYYAQRDNLLEKANQEINEVIQKYNINPEKVVVSGCSAGGYMTTRMLIAYPKLFASAIINCPALDVAQLRGGETPTDEELESLKQSETAIWLVQGATDSSVNTEDCSKRMFNILTKDQEIKSRTVEQELNSDFITYETSDNKYKLTIYETVDLTDAEDSFGVVRPMGKLQFSEDYDQDGIPTLVKYSDHWSWIYSLNNNPESVDGTHIVNWAADYTEVSDPKPENPDPIDPEPENPDPIDPEPENPEPVDPEPENPVEDNSQPDKENGKSNGPVKTEDQTTILATAIVAIAALSGIVVITKCKKKGN